jgi:hypothetical protein
MWRVQVLQPIAAQSIGVLLAVAVAAGVAALIASAAPEARAEPTIASTPLGKGGGLPDPGVDCLVQSWPNFDQDCIKRPAGKAQAVRVIAIR